MVLKGRREIFTDVKEITQENISKVLADDFSVHLQNVTEIKYLQEYVSWRRVLRGRQKHT